MKLLIVEDDLSLADILSFTLRRAGFEVQTVYDGLAAVSAWEESQPDLVVLDLNLPKLDGLAVCRHIRGQSDCPVIILSVRHDDQDIVQALEQGADDYVVKPFSPTQLIARVRAVLRRAGKATTPGCCKAKTSLLTGRGWKRIAPARAGAADPAGGAAAGGAAAATGAGTLCRNAHRGHLGAGRRRPGHAQTVGLSAAHQN